jgi:ribosomal protein L1
MYILPVPAHTYIQASIAERRARLSDPSQQSGRWKPKGSEVQTVEVVVTTQTDPRRGDQIVRGAVVLPHGTGKRKRIAVFAAGPQAEIAKAEGGWWPCDRVLA